MGDIANSTFSRDLRVSNIHSTNPNDTQSNFTVNLNRMTETNNIVRCVFKGASFINNSYNIHTEGEFKNNVFDYDIVGGTPGSVTITPSGFYTTSELLNIISPAIQAAAQVVEIGATVTMSSGSISKKVEAVVTGLIVGVVFPATGSLNKVLGNTTTATITALPAGATYVFDGTPDLYGLKRVYIHSTMMAEGNLVDGDVETHDIIGSVPVSSIVPFGGEVHYISNESELDAVNYNSFRNFDSINITLRDLDNKVIELNGGPPTEIIFKMYYI
jgi:hypothetical protein